jgi:hypothetical protein
LIFIKNIRESNVIFKVGVKNGIYKLMMLSYVKVKFMGINVNSVDKCDLLASLISLECECIVDVLMTKLERAEFHCCRCVVKSEEMKVVYFLISK